MGYGYESDKVERIGYIDRERILELFDEKDIFSLVFGFRPEEHKYVCSPFRKDREPNCWFSMSPSGRLRFIDFGNRNMKNGIRMSHLDCFDAVRLFHDLPNFYRTLDFIANNLKDKRRESAPIARKVQRVNRGPVELYFEARNFISNDADFWSPYGISRSNLLEDNVFPVSRIAMRNTKKGDVDYMLRETCYAITGFENRLKFYFPFRKGGARFITNCTENDIGNMDILPPYGSQLIITKSYKDARVIRNTGRYAVWNQNEGMEPDDDTLFGLVKRFDKVPIWYDNDRQGMISAKNLSERINREFPHKSRPVWLPEPLLKEGIKDPADVRKRSSEELEKYMKKLIL